MQDPSFWKDPQSASRVKKEVSRLSEAIELADSLTEELSELRTLADLSAEDPELARELDERIDALEKQILKEEKLTFLSGPYDRQNAIITIYAGAGGTESQDWVEMLLRMYLRYAERQRRFSARVLAVTPGGEAGLKNATILVEGPHAYGILKHEHGVHRLVRISPFSSQGLRHTSFALVEVLPEIEDLDLVEINPTDLAIDTYRAGGPGGQYVNKTESAIRITHTPTGLVVTSQAERSQGANRAQAMKLLASRLSRMLEEQHREKIEELRGERMAAEWGSQIRSYVLQPYKMVKDHRTQFETSQAEAVLDGNLDELIEAEMGLESKK